MPTPFHLAMCDQIVLRCPRSLSEAHPDALHVELVCLPRKAKHQLAAGKMRFPRLMEGVLAAYPLVPSSELAKKRLLHDGRVKLYDAQTPPP